MQKTKTFHYILLQIAIILIAYLPFYINNGFIGDYGDPLGQTIPNKFLLIEYIKNGIFPLWNSFSFLGMPFLADIQVGAFYFPDIIIFSIFSSLKAHNISVLAHIIFSSIGFFYFFKKLLKSKPIALTLSTIFCTTGTILSKLVYLNMLASYSYMPWLLLVSLQKRKVLTKISLLTAIMIFAGHPIASFQILIVVFIFTAIYYYKKWMKLLQITIGILIGLLISSIQLIPFFELSSLSVRGDLSFLEFINGILKPLELGKFLIPIFNNHDKFIHFGTLAFILLLISPFIYKKLSKKFQKIYLTGCILSIIGLFLSTLGIHQVFTKLLYEMPIINKIRVAARHIVIFHVGALICIGLYLTTLKRKTANILIILLILNSLLITNIFLERHEINKGESHYMPEIKETIERTENMEFNLRTSPKYFLSSSSFLFPNRHILNLMPNFIGYNPILSKNFYEYFPVEAVGSFSNPEYLSEYYENLLNFGLNYYIFPNEEFLIEKNLESRKSVIEFLKEKDWQLITEVGNALIWKNPSPKAFVYFENNKNKISNIKFAPGEIFFTTEMTSPDTLVVNQSYFTGWKAETETEKINAEISQQLVQSYEIKNPAKSLRLYYQPKSFIYGTILSILGIILLVFAEKKIK